MLLVRRVIDYNKFKLYTPVVYSMELVSSTAYMYTDRLWYSPVNHQYIRSQYRLVFGVWRSAPELTYSVTPGYLAILPVIVTESAKLVQQLLVLVSSIQ